MSGKAATTDRELTAMERLIRLNRKAPATASEPGEPEIRHLPLSALVPNPTQPRRSFDDRAIDELADSIRARGVIQPLLVRAHPDESERFQIVVGERRFLGLFTWHAYQENAGNIPILRQKLADVLGSANVPEGSHDYKTIVALFNDMPLEELFLVSVEDLRRQISAMMTTEDTGDVRLVLTPDTLGRGVNVTQMIFVLYLGCAEPSSLTGHLGGGELMVKPTF